MDWISTIVPEAIYGFGTFLMGFFWRKSQDNAKHYIALEKGVEAILLLELRRIHERGARQKWLSYADKASAEHIYSSYHGLGGNGQGTAILNDIRKLPSK